MTNIGYDFICQKITTMPVEVPEDPMIAIEFKAWMDGYLKAQTDILLMIEDLKRQNERT